MHQRRTRRLSRLLAARRLLQRLVARARLPATNYPGSVWPMAWWRAYPPSVNHADAHTDGSWKSNLFERALHFWTRSDNIWTRGDRSISFNYSLQVRPLSPKRQTRVRMYVYTNKPSPVVRQVGTSYTRTAHNHKLYIYNVRDIKAGERESLKQQACGALFSRVLCWYSWAHAVVRSLSGKEN